MTKTTVVIGGGVSGLTAASRLAGLGEKVVLLEKEERIGGHLLNWDRLFPNRRPGHEVMDYLSSELNPDIDIRLKQTISLIETKGRDFLLTLDHGGILRCDALLLACGFELFDASRKEEYGYGIYNNVITSADLEFRFKSGEKITTSKGSTPKRIGFVHCVGSRDEKAGNLYCSKVCCVTGVKQAIEIKEMLPEAEVFGFYMDLRMFDRHFEEMYYEAQQKWDINFLRGRVSECAENPDQSIVLKIEDTLTSRPLKMTVDLLVLLVGFMPSGDSSRLAGMLGVTIGEDRFLQPADEHIRSSLTTKPGVFLAGAVKGPVSINGAIADAGNAAVEIYNYLKKI